MLVEMVHIPKNIREDKTSKLLNIAPSSKRVTSFSVPDGDRKGHDDLTKLKKYCKNTGTNFSYLVMLGIAHIVKELDL